VRSGPIGLTRALPNSRRLGRRFGWVTITGTDGDKFVQRWVVTDQFSHRMGTAPLPSPRLNGAIAAHIGQLIPFVPLGPSCISMDCKVRSVQTISIGQPTVTYPGIETRQAAINIGRPNLAPIRITFRKPHYLGNRLPQKNSKRAILVSYHPPHGTSREIVGLIQTSAIADDADMPVTARIRPSHQCMTGAKWLMIKTRSQ
jgi:hypothetical protein